MKVVNDGLQPIFCAGLRSLFAAFLILLWLFLRKKGIKVEKNLLPAILFYGMIFGAEFNGLFFPQETTKLSMAHHQLLSAFMCANSITNLDALVGALLRSL